MGEGQTKRQIVGSLDMSSSLHQTKEPSGRCPSERYGRLCVIAGPSRASVFGRPLLSQLSSFKAETGQQTHKHGTGRCYALHPALSAEAAARPLYFTQFTSLVLVFASPRPAPWTDPCPGSGMRVAALWHCSLCLKKPCFLLPRMTSHSVRPIGRPDRSVHI